VDHPQRIHIDGCVSNAARGQDVLEILALALARTGLLVCRVKRV
jgi:hypothetical protein